MDLKKNCFLEKRTDLHQAVVFHIPDYFQHLNSNKYFFVNDLTVF